MSATALLDTLLPGGEGFPPASGVGLDGWIAGRPRFAPALAELVAALPEDFATRAPAARTATLTALEADRPELFGAVVVAAYSGYYTNPEVLAVVEARCGYKARPPQPGGYALPAFDPAILAVPRARAPLWRDPNRDMDRDSATEARP
jgi:hypothetical protein